MNPKKPKKKRAKFLTKKQLDQFLSSICESKGMGLQDSPSKLVKKTNNTGNFQCKNIHCKKAKWRAHVGVPNGLLCITSQNHHVSIMRTITVNENKESFADGIVLYQVEAEWLLRVLYLALINARGNDENQEPF